MQTKENSLSLVSKSMLKQQYVVEQVLGSGGFGITYKAYDTINKRYCTIKEFVPLGLVMRSAQGQELQVTTYEYEKDFEHGKKRFVEEAEILKELSYLPQIVQISDCFAENNTVYFVMEYIDGVNLKQLMEVYGGCIPLKDALEIICSAGMTLEQVHERTHIFHRDISPDNIMVTIEGKIKLIDFGNAKYLIEKRSQTLSVVLKQGYAPPEQYSSTGHQGSFTDVYSLAATFYYIVTGVRIPTAADRLGGTEYVKLSVQNPAVPRYVSDAVDHALVLNSRFRTQTMGEFIRELQPAAEKHPYVKQLGRESEMKWRLVPDETVVIGRSESQSDIVPGKDGRVSKSHCELCYDSIMECFCLVDHSSNGTYRNGERLEKGKVYGLQAGDTFTIGRNIYVMKVGMEYV